MPGDSLKASVVAGHELEQEQSQKPGGPRIDVRFVVGRRVKTNCGFAATPGTPSMLKPERTASRIPLSGVLSASRTDATLAWSLSFLVVVSGTLLD